MTAINKNLIPAINQSLEVSIPDTAGLEELKEKLAAHINFLINNHFDKLIFYLYRIDVSESKLKNLLAQNEGNKASAIIADLIIERQLQKIETRKQSGQQEPSDENEKW